MTKTIPPHFDKEGLNILDQNDTLGIKSEYISILQKKSYERYMPRGDGNGTAVDLGCGFGRLSSAIAKQGWKVIGVDPDPQLLDYAHAHNVGVKFILGGLPHLPVPKGSIDLLVMQNLLRALHISQHLDLVEGIGEYLSESGTIFIVDNMRLHHINYVTESDLIKLFESEGFKLTYRVPIRASRWWMNFLIRYGIIPRNKLEKIADYELNKMATKKTYPRYQYYNVIFVFKKNSITV